MESEPINLNFLENVQLSSKLNANFACQYSEDDRIFIVADSGVLILTLKGYLAENILPNFSFRKDLIKLSKFSLSDEVGIGLNEFYDDLSRSQLYEAVLRLDLWGHVVNEPTTEPKAVTASWSPRGLIGSYGCALSVLTNLKALIIYNRYVGESDLEEYVEVANVTQKLVQHFWGTWSNLQKMGAKELLDELKYRVECVSPTAFCWSHLIKTSTGNFCILFVGHPNGTLTAWKMKHKQLSDTSPSELEFVGTYQTKFIQITALHWYQTGDFTGGLSVGNHEGRLLVFLVGNLADDLISFNDETTFWDELDNLRIDSIVVNENNNVTFLFAIKQNFILISAINESGLVVDQKIYDASGLIISDFRHFEGDTYLVLTLTGSLKALTVFLCENAIVVEEKIVPVKVDLRKYRTHGLILSRNKILLGILCFPSKICDIIKEKLLTNIYFFSDGRKDIFQILMANNSGILRDHWDYLETLRMICYKEKRFPWIGIDVNLEYDTLSLLELKTLNQIAKLSEKVYSIVRQVNEYNIKPYVLVNYLVTIKLAVKRIKKLLNLQQSGKTLSTFQMQSIDVCQMFLKEMVARKILEKANVGENFINEIFDVVSSANVMTYPDMPQCFWCGEKIIGTSCIPPHSDSRCAISMMPILFIPGYKCPYCKCVVHKEIENELSPVCCPYCDVEMFPKYNSENIQRHIETIPDHIKSIAQVALSHSVPQLSLSTCYEDCLIGDTDPGEIEENLIEYVTVTDSEDEEEVAERGAALREAFYSLNTEKKREVNINYTGDDVGEILRQLDSRISESEDEASDIESEEIKCS